MDQLVTYNSLVGYELERIRLSKGIDQSVLAELSGMSQPVLSRLERGKASISIDQLFVVCLALDVSPLKVIESASEAVEAMTQEESVQVKTTKEIGAGTALLTGAAVGAVLGILLSKRK